MASEGSVCKSSRLFCFSIGCLTSSLHDTGISVEPSTFSLVILSCSSGYILGSHLFADCDMLVIADLNAHLDVRLVRTWESEKSGAHPEDPSVHRARKGEIPKCIPL